MDRAETYRGPYAKTYSEITASGNSRLHLGDTYHISHTPNGNREQDFIESLAPAASALLQVFEFAVRVTELAGTYLDPAADIEIAVTEDETDELFREYEAINEIFIVLPAGDDDAYALAIGKDLHKQVDNLLMHLPYLLWDMLECGQERVILRRHLGRMGPCLNWLAKFLLGLWKARVGDSVSEAPFGQHGQQRVEVKLSRSDTDLIRRLAVMKRKSNVQIQKLLLKSLSFEHMTQRKREIPDTYGETYQWALSDQSQGLRTWLRTGNGFYWITGKAGSGKSTLMRYLREHRETRALLEHWSGSRELVLLHFYFWYPGASLQKSTLGLMRAILHQLLELKNEHQPNPLITLVWPQFFIGSRRVTDSYNWSEEELVNALQTIARQPYRSRSIRFCVFVDGLDEYYGNHANLLDLLSRLVKRMDVKMCVASRPWNVFSKAFEHVVPHLRLEELTRPDIRAYVHGQIARPELSRSLGESRRYLRYSTRRQRGDDLEKLMDTIVERAEGVFLWVFFVVRSILSGLNEGDSVSILQRRVEEFPRDLEKFFRSILLRVEGVYKHQTYQCLKLACLYTENPEAEHLSSWVDFWLICDSSDGFAADTASGLDIQTLDAYDEALMQDELRKSLSASCKDLLYLPEPIRGAALDYRTAEARYGTLSSIKVTWLHRTVYDFLSLQEMQDIVDSNVPSFYRNGQYYNSFGLARAKFLRGCHDPEHVGQTLRAAVSQDLPLLSEGYLEDVERVLCYHHERLLELTGTATLAEQLFGEAGAEVVALLLASGFTNFMDRIQVPKLKRGKKPQRLAQCIISTVVGKHPLLPTRPCDIDTGLLDLVLLKWPAEYDDLRDLFFANWTSDQSTLNDLELRRVWDIAKSLLQLEPRILKHPDKHKISIAFLEERLPSEWLAEIEFETCPSGQCKCILPQGSDIQCSTP